MRPSPNPGFVLASLVLLALVIFIVDTMVPLGVAMGLPYVAVVLVSFLHPLPWVTHAAAITSTVLIAAGYVVSEQLGISWQVFANRALAIGAVWGTAWSVLLNKRLVNRQATRLARSHDLQRVVFDVSVEMIAVADVNGRFVQVNPAWERVLGFTAADMTGTHWADLVHPDDVDESTSAAREIMTGATVVGFRNRYRTRNGDYRWLSWQGARAPGELVIATARDITDEREAAEQLRMAEERLALGVDGVSDGVWDWPDIERNTMWWSPHMFQLLGVDQDAFPADIERWRERIHPDHRAGALEAIRRAVKPGAEPLDLEYPIRGANDQYRWVRVRGKTRPGLTADTVRMTGGVTDVHELRETVRSLTVTREKLEQSNQELEQFALVASHDLQEPVRKMRFFSDLLVAADHHDEASEYAGKIHNAAERMHQLISDLLDYSRVNTRGVAMRPVALDDALRDVMTDLEMAVLDTQAIIDWPDVLPAVTADPVQLRRLLLNLISNAIKYRHPERRPEIKIVARDGGELTELLMSDNGIGFDDEFREKIFEVFGRLHGRGEYEGTGMGLAICRRIVERHGGSITATGTPAVGATFSITLPTAAVADAAVN